MKNKLVITALLAGMLALTAACGGKDKTAEEAGIAAEFPNSKVTKLGSYKGVEVPAVSVEVTDEEIQAQIDNLLNSYPDVKTVEGKTTIEEGDIVNIDFVGKLDGEPFEGGSSGEGGTNLEIGSGSFIDGFEDGLIGKTTGSTVELPLTFPEEYSLNPDLAGKDVVFEVTIHDIVEYVTPEWNDEFVQKNTEYASVDAYVEAARELMKKQKEENAKGEEEYSVMEAIIADSEFECDEKELQSLKDTQIQQYETYASYYGVGLDEFLLSAMQLTREAFDEQINEMANFQLKCTLIVDAVAREEKLTLTDEEYKEGLESLAGEFNAESPEAFEKQYGRDMVENSLLYDKTVDFLTEHAVEI